MNKALPVEKYGVEQVSFSASQSRNAVQVTTQSSDLSSCFSRPVCLSGKIPPPMDTAGVGGER